MPIVPWSAAILSAALLGMAFANSRAADFEEPLSLFSQASSLMRHAARPVGVVWSPPRRIGGQSKIHDYCG
jgi:hypothetical protein